MKHETLYCTFCGKSQEEVQSLVYHRPEAIICNDCVDLCVELLKGQADATRIIRAGDRRRL